MLFDVLRTHFRRLLYGAPAILSDSLVSGTTPLLSTTTTNSVTSTTKTTNTTYSSIELPFTGIHSISYATYAANEPIEDRFLLRVHNGALLAAVFDGHGGWQAAEFAHRELPHAIVAEMANISSNPRNEPPEAEEVVTILSRAFTRTDRAFLSAVRGAFQVGFGDVAKVGCCALAAVITPKYIVVANAGDCRAVYGQLVPADLADKYFPDVSTSLPATLANASPIPSFNTNTQFFSDSDDGSSSTPPPPHVPGGRVLLKNSEYSMWATALSEDHNARMPREAARLRAAHPGESDIVRCSSPGACYVKGRLQPTRALGDAYLKHSEFNAPAPSDFLDGSTGPRGYPSQTIGSASIMYGLREVGNLATDASLATVIARRWGRHVPAPYTPPYITATPETRILRLANPVTSSSNITSSLSNVASSLSNSSDSEQYSISDPNSSSSSYPSNFQPSSDYGIATLPDSLLTDPRTQRFLILACDGLWDVLSNEEAVHFVASDTGPREGVATRLVSHVLEREAARAGMSVTQLMNLPAGRKRRSLHDDITAIVVFLDSKGQQLGTSHTEEKKKTSWLW
jgi:serine/threonine protein phosphatase PrpC